MSEKLFFLNKKEMSKDNMTPFFFCLKMMCEGVVPRTVVPILQMRVKMVNWNKEWNLVSEDIY